MAFSASLTANSSTSTTLRKIVTLTLANATNFTVGGDISSDGDNSNDAIGIIQSKSGNVVNVIITSGDFVASNGIDNSNPYASDETTITTIDNIFFEVVYDVQNRNINEILLYLNYTKDANNLAILAKYQDSDQDSTNFFSITKTAADTGNVSEDIRNITASGKYRLSYELSKNEEDVIFQVVPVAVTDDDVLVLFVAENNLGT